MSKIVDRFECDGAQVEIEEIIMDERVITPGKYYSAIIGPPHGHPTATGLSQNMEWTREHAIKWIREPRFV